MNESLIRILKEQREEIERLKEQLKNIKSRRKAQINDIFEVVNSLKSENKKVTLDSIGNDFGLTRERIRQILKENNMTIKQLKDNKWVNFFGQVCFLEL